MKTKLTKEDVLSRYETVFVDKTQEWKTIKIQKVKLSTLRELVGRLKDKICEGHWYTVNRKKLDEKGHGDIDYFFCKTRFPDEEDHLSTCKRCKAIDKAFPPEILEEK